MNFVSETMILSPCVPVSENGYKRSSIQVCSGIEAARKKKKVETLPLATEDSDDSEEDGNIQSNGGPVADNFHPQNFLQSRVAKNINGEVCFGTIKDYWKMRGKTNQWCWRVEYDNFESEDFYHRALLEGMELYRRKTAHGSTSTEHVINNATTQDPNDFINARVAKFFGEEKIFFGSITNYDEEEKLWFVQYDDGDTEEWDRCEVKIGMQACLQNVNRLEYNLWTIYGVSKDDERWVQGLPSLFQMNRQSVAKFYLFMLERQRCWIRRKNYLKEKSEMWTNDPILRNHHFCNNYRELDRGTAFFRSQMLELWDECNSSIDEDLKLSREDWFLKVLWASYCYRLVNKVESFPADDDKNDLVPARKLGRIPTIDKWPNFKTLVLQTHEEGQAFFTGAHQTCSFHNYIEWMDSVYRNRVRLEHVVYNSNTLEECFLAIKENLPGCGAFMSWQVLCDLCECNCIKESQSMSFCHLGPGAKAGISEIFFSGNKDLNLKDVEYLTYAKMLVENQENVFTQLKFEEKMPLPFPKWRSRSLTLKEVEHALCEFSKYQRIERDGMGHRHRKSRCHLDSTNTCGRCNGFSCMGFVLCDTCNLGYCEACDTSKKDPISWICRRCDSLESHEWTTDDFGEEENDVYI